MIQYFDDSRQEVRENKEFISEQAEKFAHIDGGLYNSDDWTGEETEDDPQNSTIQIRGGDDAQFDGEKLREREMSLSDDGKLYAKTNTGLVVEYAQKLDLDSLGDNLTSLSGAYDLTVSNLDALIGNVNTLRQLTNGSVSNGYVGDDGCLYLTNSAGAVVVGPLGPFAGGGGEGGGGGGGQVYSRITLESAFDGGERSFTITEENHAPIKIRWSSTDVDTGLDTGNGILTLYKTGNRLYSKSVAQGEVEIDVKEHVTSGDNDFRITITDINNQSRSIVFNYTLVALSISTDFVNTRAFQGDIQFSCTPSGTLPKRVVYKVDDTIIYTSPIINASNSRTSYTIPAQSHGRHKLYVWAEADLQGGGTITSDVLYYEILCVEAGNNATIMASSFNVDEVVQYTPLQIEFRVYNARSASVDGTITIKTTDTEGVESTSVSDFTIGRTAITYQYRPDTVGDVEITIRANEAFETFNLRVTESDIKAKATTDSMVLYLSSAGRSNSERNPGNWTYKGINTSFSNFDWVSSGWVVDNDGDVGLQLLNDARAVINYKPHEIDWKRLGKTIEIEFRSHTVRDYDAKIIQCFVGDKGFYITPTKLVLQYVGGSIEAPFKEDEHLTLAITVEKQTGSFTNYRLIRLYINGICSAAIQYPESAVFSQDNGEAVPITIGSNDAGVTLYKIRIYDTELTRRQVVDNWIVDTKAIEKMLARYTRNDIYDTNGNILISKLPEETPYLIISTPLTLPTLKKDPAVQVSGYFIWPEHPEKSFAFYDGELTVQGTSSEGYDIKNWKLKFARGFYMLSSKETVSKFKMRDNSVGINKPCLKADYASSENANNVVLVRLYNELNPYRTPHQQVEDYKVAQDVTYQPIDIRQGIDGFGITMFRATDNDLRTKVLQNSLDLDGIANLDATFMGKYNFNNDKGNEAVFGFTEGDESWEWIYNTGGIVNMLDGEMDDWEAEIDDGTGKLATAWKTQIECRYPEDNEDYTNIKAFIDFLKSTDVITPIAKDRYLTEEQTAAIEAETDETAKASLIEQFKNAFKDTRLKKFHAQLGDWIELNAFAFNFIFKEFFLMIDSWSKNAFWTRMHDTVGGEEVQSKWFDLPYDFDTALGIDNNGNLVFSPFLEGTDHYVTIPKSALDPDKTYDIITETVSDGVPYVKIIEWSSDPVDGGRDRTIIYNGQDNTLYQNWQNPDSQYGFMDLSRSVYQGLRSSEVLSFKKVHDMFTEHQSTWSESLYNEDGEVKYLSVLYNRGSNAQLPKLLGSKASQRDYWLYYRFLYMDSKYIAGSGAGYIETRTFAPEQGLTITPYVTSYVTAEWGNNRVYVQRRVHADESAFLPSTSQSTGSDSANDNVLYIYSAALVKDLGDLSRNQLAYIDFTKAVDGGRNIVRVKVGDSSPDYVNSHFTKLTFGTLESGAQYPMCKVIDARNCINLGSGESNTDKTIYLKSCINLEEAYFDGTSIEGLSLPTGGTLRVLHYSASAKSIVIKDQPNITDLVVPNWNQCDVVNLENVGDAVDLKNLYTQLKDKASVRLSGFEWTANSVEEIKSWLNAIDAKQFNWLDETGNSTRIEGQDYADQERTLNCTIYVDYITGADVYEIKSKWIGVNIIATESSAVCTFMNGDTELTTYTVYNGGNAVYEGETPFKAFDAEYDYEFAGWGLTPDATEPYANALIGLNEDRTVYAVYTATHRTFVVRFYNDASLLDENLAVEYGTHPVYHGDVPVSITNRRFTGWSYNETSFVEDLNTITVTSDMTFYATFLSSHVVTFYNDTRLLQTKEVDHGGFASYAGNNPRKSNGAPFLGWSPDDGMTLITNLSTYPIYTDTTFKAQFTPSYTVRFFRYAGDAVPVYTAEDVFDGTDASYTGPTVVGDHGEALLSWNPSNLNVTEDRDCIAVFETLYKCEYYVGNELYYTDEYLHYGDNSTCEKGDPTVSGKKFAGWVPSPTNITKDTKVYATFGDTYSVQYFADEDDENPIYIDEGLDPGDDSTFVGTLPTGEYDAPFVRWDPEPINVQSNMYVYAVYEPRYTVNFFSENGAVTYHSAKGVAPDATVAYPSNAPVPTKNGYEFIGWAINAIGTVYPDTSSIVINANTNFYAQFRKLNTVRFYVNGSLDATVNSVSTGSHVAYPNGTPVDTEQGGTFLGWAIDNAGTVYNDLSQVTINNDTDFYAKFSTAYVVKFYLNDTDVTPYETVKGVAPGGTATPTKGTPTKTGYLFTAWDPEPTNIQGNINVYAEWEKVHTVRYLVDGTVVQSSSTIHTGEAYPYTGATPTKTGYEFDGWLPTEPTNVTGDVDCVAQFTQLHTVRFMDGTTVLQSSSTVRHGTYATFTGSTPTKTDYIFSGWDKDPATTVINANTDFVAQWAEKPKEEAAWKALFASIDGGTYETDYHVDDKIPYKINNKTYNAVIAGIKKDTDENGNLVPISFITEELYETKYPMNDTSTNAGGWASSKFRASTIPSILDIMPSYITDRIKSVKKVSYDKTTSAEQTTYDELWIPSCQEVGFTISNIETTGPVYSELFTSDNATRIKKVVGKTSGTYYWTRTANSGSTASFRCVNSNGSYDYGIANSDIGVALGFSVGKVDEQKAWTKLANAITNDTYRDDYHVGDEIPYTTTDGDTYTAVIAGIGKDVDENGQAIPISFVTKGLWKTKYPMNSSATNEGGWDATVMQNTTLPSLKAKLPSYITSHIVAAKKVSMLSDNTEQTTYDELWIPSCQEVGFTGYETNGVVYNELFIANDSNTRKKMVLGGTSNTYWWLRTADSGSTTNFRIVNDNGGNSSSGASNGYGVALGFSFR